MRAIHTALLAAILIAAVSIAFELSRLNSAMLPLNRIPVTNPVTYGQANETREQRIDRIARTRIQTREDNEAVDARVKELLAERDKRTAQAR